MLLGYREREVLSVVQALGSGTVRQVTEQLHCGLAYTTVMTTLDRLFRKGLLQRKRERRAFLYTTTVSAHDLEEWRANHLVRRLFSETNALPEMLISCLVDAVHSYDADLLDQLESSIRAARARSMDATVDSLEPEDCDEGRL